MKELEGFLRSHFSRDVLIPCAKGSKSPLFAHAHHSWTWERFDRFLAANVANRGAVAAASHHDLALILHDICVVDVDGDDRVREFEELFASQLSAGVPVVQTARGRHYWFRRPEKADAHGYYDGAGQRRKGLDFKTVSRTGTGGIVCVPPSTGKRWLRAGPPRDAGDLRDIPDEILDHVAVGSFRTSTHTLLTMRFADGHVARVPASHHVQTMAYFEPFFSADTDTYTDADADAVIPVPCTFAAFSRLLEFLETRCIRPRSTLEARLALAATVRALGVLRQERVVRELACGIHVHREELADAFPEWPAEKAQEALVALDAGTAATVTYRPPDGKKAETVRRLFDATCTAALRGLIRRPHRLSPGDPVLLQDPGNDAAARVPAALRRALQMFPGRLVLAGGAALAAVAPALPDPGDYDLFLVDTRGGEEGEVVEALRDLLKPSASTVTGNAITFVFAHEVSEVSEKKKKKETVVQLIVRRYPCLRDVLTSFDVTPCKVAMYWEVDDGWQVRCVTSWIPCMTRMAFPLDVERWSTSSVYRCFKYFAKGFEVYIPGCRRRDTSSRRKNGSGSAAAGGTLSDLFSVESRLLPLSYSRWPGMDHVTPELRRACRCDYESRVDVARSMKYVVKAMVRFGYVWLSWMMSPRAEQKEEEEEQPWPVYDPRCPVMAPASPGWEEVAPEPDAAFGIIR